MNNKEAINIPDRHNSRNISPTDIKCLSFFSGALGLDFGLEASGITTLLTSEIEQVTRRTISANWPEVGLIGDIRNYCVEDILSFAGLSKNDDIDVVAGGPPCQAFSTAGHRRGFEDERGNVFLHYINTAIQLQPKIIVIENVRGLLSAALHHIPHKNRDKKMQEEYKGLRGGALLYIVNKLRSHGYSVSFNLYNSANFGSPQIRERVIILCSRDGIKMPYLVPTNSETGKNNLPKWRTLKDALHGLSQSQHDYIKFPEKRLKYYRLLGEGENWRCLPEELQREALGNSFEAGGGKTGFLRRLAWDKPSPTLVTSPAMPATDLAHPVEDRPLSIQEYKRIQEFPDGWKVEGTIQEQYRQIGNAVPVSLAKAIGKAIVTRLKKLSYGNQNIDFQYSRYKNTDDISWELDVMKQRNIMENKKRYIKLF